MLSQEYLKIISQWGTDVKHILDCPESNIPVLSKSKANYHTEKIKMVCPRMIPNKSLSKEEYYEEYKKANQIFESLKSLSNLKVH